MDIIQSGKDIQRINNTMRAANSSLSSPSSSPVRYEQRGYNAELGTMVMQGSNGQLSNAAMITGRFLPTQFGKPILSDGQVGLF